MAATAEREFFRKELNAGGEQVHSTNPMYLIEKIIRERILDSMYWKEQCFGLNAATLCDRAAALTHIGGQYGTQKPTDFLCLEFKLLQINPGQDIVREYLQADDFKYLQALAAFHVRLTWPAQQVYATLEPMLQDYKKLRYRGDAGFHLTHMDEFIDQLLTQDRVCDIALPRLTSREVLEELDLLDPWISPLDAELNPHSDSDSDSE